MRSGEWGPHDGVSALTRRDQRACSFIPLHEDTEKKWSSSSQEERRHQPHDPVTLLALLSQTSAPRTVREFISVVKAPQSVVLCYGGLS